MHKPKILFIGGGNMTTAILSGLVTNAYAPTALTVLDRHAEKCAALSTQFHINTVDQITENVLDADIIVLAIKPQAAKVACSQLRAFLKNRKPLILSVMAGVTIDSINSLLGGNFPIVRAMPNTAALVKAGATGLFAASSVTPEQKLQIETLISSIGIWAWLEQETEMDTITALSGSGPAYFFLMLEAMQMAAVQLGLPAEIAKQFSIQTAYGAAVLAQNSQKSLATLRADVTSKGGTTEAALAVFQAHNFSQLIADAMQAAKERAEILSRL